MTQKQLSCRLNMSVSTIAKIEGQEIAMSKKVRNILLLLALVCFASIVLNIVQYAGNTTNSSVIIDSTAVNQRDSLMKLVEKQKIKIAELNNKINNTNNKNSNNK